MKWFIKISKIVMYPALFVLGIYILSPEAFNVFSGSSSDGKGVPVKIAMYFDGADIFNLFFIVITFGIGIGVFVILSLAVDWVFKRIGKKYSRLNFINAESADLWLQIPVAFVILFALVISTANIVIPVKANKLRINSANDIKVPTPAFVLGTSKYLQSSTPENPKVNLYYKYRIDAAIDLWNAGKIKYFILSGDGVGKGHSEKYDETEDMTKDLLAAGVPADKIKIDRYGFNTQNSIIRLRGVFKLNSIVLVSQNFQNVRAALMSEHYGINAMSYDAKGSATSKMFFKEVLQSRPKLVIDLLFLNMQPDVKTLKVVVDGKEMIIEGDYQTHEEFDVTKSDRHVWTIVIFIAAVIIIIAGVTRYLGKTGEERKKFAIKLSVMTVGISALLFISVMGVYKIVPNSFVDDLVESVAADLGVKTKKMEKKEELRVAEEVKRTEAETLNVTPTVTAVVEEKAPEPVPVADTKTAEAIFSNVASEDKKEKKDSVRVVYVSKEEAPVDPFGNIAAEEEQPVKKTLTKKSVTLFKAAVNSTTELVNGGNITLRLAEAVEIDGVKLPVNYLFQCNTAVISGKFLLQADQIGKAPIEIKNYENGKEGTKVTEKHQGKKGQVILAEGEEVTLGY